MKTLLILLLMSSMPAYAGSEKNGINAESEDKPYFSKKFSPLNEECRENEDDKTPADKLFCHRPDFKHNLGGGLNAAKNDAFDSIGLNKPLGSVAEAPKFSFEDDGLITDKMSKELYRRVYDRVQKEFQQQLEDTQAQLQEVRTALQDTRKELRQNVLENDLKVMVREQLITSLQKRLEEKNASEQGNQLLSTENSELKADNEVLHAEKDKLGVEIAGLKEKLLTFREANATFSIEVTMLRYQQVQIKAENAELKAEIAQWVKEVAALKEENEALAETNGLLKRGRVAFSSQEAANRQTQSSEGSPHLQAMVAHLSEQNQQLEAEKEELTLQNTQLKEQNNCLHAENNRLIEQNSPLNSSIVKAAVGFRKQIKDLEKSFKTGLKKH